MLVLGIFALFNASLAMYQLLPTENEKLLKDCALQQSAGKLRLLNGVKSVSGEMRYVVMIQIGEDSVNRCTGTIISPRHVLTAAHCFKTPTICPHEFQASRQFTKPKIYVHYGGNCVKMNENGDCDGERECQKIESKSVVIPARYAENGCKLGDIAIVELPNPLDFSDANLDLACLPQRETVLAEKLFSAGYGNDPNDSDPDQKIMAKANFKPDKYCDSTLVSKGGVGNDSFCTEEEEQFMCKGDSGSGVMQKWSSTKDTVVGLLHGGISCDEASDVMDDKNDNHFIGSVNTDVRRYLGWICFSSGICGPEIDRAKFSKRMRNIEVL